MKRKKIALRAYEVTETVTVKKTYHVLAANEDDAERYVRCGMPDLKPISEEEEESEIQSTGAITETLYLPGDVKQ